MLIRRLTLTPTQLASLPPEERALLYVVAHALNEVNVVLKLFLLASNYSFEPLVVRHAQLCQSMVLSKILVGKVHETWMAITKGYLRTTLAKVYDGQLDPEHAMALDRLKKYFGKSNVIESVRNSFAFHYSVAHANKEPAPDTPPEELALYFGPTVGTTLYQFAEQAMGMAMLDEIDPNDAQVAYDRLSNETHQVVSWLNDFGQGLLFTMLEKHLSLTSRVDELEIIHLSNVPDAADVQIPFFFELQPTKPEDSEA